MASRYGLQTTAPRRCASIPSLLLLLASATLLLLSLPSARAQGMCPFGSSLGMRCTNCTSLGDGCQCDAFRVCRPSCTFIPGVDYKAATWRRSCATCPSLKSKLPNAACTCDLAGTGKCVDFCALPQNNNGVTPCKGCNNATGNGCVCSRGQCVDACSSSNTMAALVRGAKCTVGCTAKGKDGCVCSTARGKCVPFCNEKDGAQCQDSPSGEGYCRAGVCYDICAIAKSGTVCKTCDAAKSGGSCVCSSSGKCVTDTSCTNASPVPLPLAPGSFTPVYPCASCPNAYYYPVNNVNVVTAPGCRCAGKGQCVEPCSGGMAEGAVCSSGASCTDTTNGCRCTGGRCRPFCELPANDGAACGDGFVVQGVCSGGKCLPKCMLSGSNGLQCSYNCTNQVCMCQDGQCVPQCSLPSAEGSECFDDCDSKGSCRCFRGECVNRCLVPANEGTACPDCATAPNCKCQSGSCVSGA